MTRRFTLSINTEHAAFHDAKSGEHAPASELARILRRIASALEQDPRGPWQPHIDPRLRAREGGLHQNILDVNGNVVGTYYLHAEAGL